MLCGLYLADKANTLTINGTTIMMKVEITLNNLHILSKSNNIMYCHQISLLEQDGYKNLFKEDINTTTVISVG